MTLCISENKSLNLEKGRCIYLVVTVFCLIFSMVYESFSHEVYSPYMFFAVALPLICGLVMTEMLRLFPKRFYPRRLSVNLYNSGIATLTIGSIVRGVLDIYGTENPLVIYYAIVGISLAVLGIFIWIISIPRKCGK